MGLFSFLNRGIVPNCVPRALVQGAAWKYQKQLDVRFIVTELEPGQDHVQCQVWKDDKWQWSVMLRGIVTTGKREQEGRDYKNLTWNEFLLERMD